jgi:hypothetical protein
MRVNLNMFNLTKGIGMLEQINENTFLLNSFGVGDFVFALQKYIKEGYELDDSNEGYPVQYVGNFSCRLIKKEGKSTTRRTKVEE